ncbi:kinase-like protein [Coniophora puteana RWD-64-598 SS2]|uniref:non-specific serine/threonine protein kinase n=1 Tax=Coniophora puteana (strain RWD-64-598) TaxID=741705 RepID=A0A5M3N0D6_CONPW|nr:kinase-like protein [Coniophora puteana RWD-64-598 SS2]EIW84849.1 kinase-like protein [Coniophora puteana RWD-64-598 SS2]
MASVNIRAVLASLPSRPWVAGLVDVFSDRINLYTLLELAHGGTLADLIQNSGPFDSRTASFYFSNIVCGLGFLHRQGIVHRDVKPDNLLVNADGYLVLTDFGLSVMEKDTRGDFEDFRDEGTDAYMAPELDVKPRDKFIPQAVDWWAAGVVLFQMVTKRLPFNAPTKTRLVERIQSGQCRWWKRLRIKPQLKNIIRGLLKHYPRQRLGSNCIEDVMGHPWLQDINWNMMEKRLYSAPWTPPPLRL